MRSVSQLFAWLARRNHTYWRASPASRATPLGYVRRVDTGAIIHLDDVRRARERDYAAREPYYPRKDEV